MLAILWLICWATVGEALYNDYNWYTSDDGATNEFQSQRMMRENFTSSLRSLAQAYIPIARDGDNEMTIAKAKSKLRMLMVYKPSGSSRDFEPNKGQPLPLSEGAKYCTMGKHTKVDCNHCTCVAGQLYMCTGMICPKAPAKPRLQHTCKEGKRRKVDSCNYCYCRNGHEICSTRDCRNKHSHLLRTKTTCREGHRRMEDCNRCFCYHGHEYCTVRNCAKKPAKTNSELWKKLAQTKLKPLKKQSQTKLKPAMPSTPEGRCHDDQTLKIGCSVCKCSQNRWHCTDNNCVSKKKQESLLWAKCREGTSRQIDACNTCYCRMGREYCETKDCFKEQKLQYYHNLRKPKTQCKEGTFRKIDSCNYCLCLNGTEKCTSKNCFNNDLDNLRKRRKRVCDRWDVKYEKCNRCVCHIGQWVCTQKQCKGGGSKSKKKKSKDERGMKKKDDDFESKVCKKGETRKLDNCNSCYCRKGQWLCEIQDCKEPKTQTPESFIEIPAIKIPNVKKSDIVNYLINMLNNYREENGNDPLLPELDHIMKIPENVMNAIKSFDPKISGNVGNNENIEFDGLVAELDSNSEEVLPNAENKEPLSELQLQLTCKEGKKRKIDSCNYCSCRNGREICSNRECRQIYANLPPDCERGQKILVDCIQCKCLSSKKGWKCDKNKKENCVLDEEKKMRTFKSPTFLRGSNSENSFEHKPCTIGERHRVDACNYCYCNEDGERVCSKNKCKLQEKIDASYTRNVTESRCIIGTRFRKGVCNYCYCNYDRELVCSNNKCRRSPWRVKKTTARMKPKSNYLSTNEKACTEGSHREVDECNYCVCLSGAELCTQKDCSSDSIMPLSFSEPECEEGEPLRPPDSCNVCICLNSEILCTNYPCYGRQSAPKHLRSSWRPPPKICFINERYRIDNCNYCYCSPQRQRVCTDYKCHPTKIDTRYAKNRPTRGCHVGTRWRKGKCEICYCYYDRRIRCFIKESLCNATNETSTTARPKLQPPPAPKPQPPPAPKPQPPPAPAPGPKAYYLRTNERVCAEGSHRQIDECNDCICFNGAELCTQKDCSTVAIKSKSFSASECEVGEPLLAPDPCNVCICLNSEILCTKNSCIARQSSKVYKYKKHKWTPPPKYCNYRERYRIDRCNYCYCSPKRQRICDDYTCPRNMNTPKRGCDVGTRWIKGKCKICYCYVDRVIRCFIDRRVCPTTTTTTTEEPPEPPIPPESPDPPDPPKPPESPDPPDPPKPPELL